MKRFLITLVLMLLKHKHLILFINADLNINSTDSVQFLAHHKFSVLSVDNQIIFLKAYRNRLVIFSICFIYSFLGPDEFISIGFHHLIFPDRIQIITDFLFLL
jgi:hypothetical protein